MFVTHYSSCLTEVVLISGHKIWFIEKKKRNLSQNCPQIFLLSEALQIQSTKGEEEIRWPTVINAP